MALLLESAFRERGWNAHKHVESTDGMLRCRRYIAVPSGHAKYRTRALAQLSAAQARRSSCERNHLQVRRSAKLQADREERWAGRIYFLGFGYAKAWEIYSAAASTSTIHSSSGMARGHVPPCTVLRRCGDTFWPGEHVCVRGSHMWVLGVPCTPSDILTHAKAQEKGFLKRA